MKNPFEHALDQLSRANTVSPLNPDLLQLLSQPQREIRVSIPVRMDDGSLRLFEGYRVQHNNARGPYKGGIRFHQDTDIHEVKALALWMAIKCAVANIPMGGGKGGVAVNPKNLSKTELEKLSRGWVRAFVDVIGPQKDVPAPDVNTTPEIMNWMNEEYALLTGDTSGAVITGKPLGKGGSEGRGTATAQGGFFVFDILREQLQLPASCRVVIQGFGNAGAHAAEIWEKAGHVIIATSDSRGAIVKDDGIDISALEAHKKETGSVLNFPGSRSISNDELLALECDLLIPAALENQITIANADAVRAKAILELANGPTTPEADDILFAKHIPLMPDILANSGGVTVSTYEWEQNLKKEQWSAQDVVSKLKQAMNSEALNVYTHAMNLKTDLRRAAFLIALERIGTKMGL